MYRCRDCGHLFEEGEEYSYTETHGFYGAGETFSFCPVCRGSFFKVERCSVCDEYCMKEGEEFCDDCKVDVKQRFKKLLHKNFKDEEIKLLNELYEGEFF